MSRKIYISPSNQLHNTYATGNTNEKEQCHKIARACVDYLKKKDIERYRSIVQRLGLRR